MESKTANLEVQLEEVFANDYDKLYSCAYRLTGNHENAQDVLQEAYIKAHTNLQKFRGDAKIYTWVYRILINECYRFLKYIKKLPLTLITEELGVSEKVFFDSISYTPSFDDDLIIDEMREKCLHAFLNCLPKNQRVCFLLKNCLDLKYKEIAEILDLSISNVKVTLFRARNNLKELFYLRCNLIDPNNPCKCHLWIKYMKDNDLPLPAGYVQPKTNVLKKEYFKKMDQLQKIGYLYTVEPKFTRQDFIYNLKKLSQVL